MTGDIITYDYYGSLYINLTNRCDCRCVFCIRDQADSSLGGLWLQEEPKKEDVLAEILGQDLTQYAEIVFCGYGEPTCRLDDLLWICDRLHAAHPPEHQRPRQPHLPPGRDAGAARPAGRRLRLAQRLERSRLPRHHPPRRRRSRLAGHAGLRAERPEVRPQGHGLHRGLRKNPPGDRSLPPPGRKPRRHLPRAPLRRVTKRKVV